MRNYYILIIDRYSFKLFFLAALLGLIYGEIRIELLIQVQNLIQFSYSVINVINYEKIQDVLVFTILISKTLKIILMNYNNSYHLLLLTNIFHPPVFKY